jgi:tRNA-splicing ligase RtcB
MKREIRDTRRPVKIWASELEGQAEQQVRNVANLPFIHSHVAVMPDAHAGKGSTIGTVIATAGAILPAAVGVDIGCGMCALRLPLRREQLGDLRALRASIERSIPVGTFGNRNVSDRVGEAFKQLGLPPSLEEDDPLVSRALLQLGSLGGGNHFIEICMDEEEAAWILLHSGSRNIGNVLADRHITEAKGLLRDRLASLPDPDLAHLVEGTPEFKAYVEDMLWAQRYAKANRNEMLLRVLKDVSRHVYRDERLLADLGSFFRVDCHHNYCQQETHFGRKVWLTRKGAVSARAGEYGIVPGSMGARSYIVRGKGNPESFQSCAHGAGRRMSRTEAKRRFTEKDLREQTEGVECRKDREVLDELPRAYKDIDQVMRDQDDLVEPVYRLKQVIVVKGG